MRIATSAADGVLDPAAYRAAVGLVTGTGG
jgi:hypothetical protein